MRMRAMILNSITTISENREPLTLSDIMVPKPARDEILLRVSACGVCHTELDEIEGRTPPPGLPVVPGHQVIGYVEDANGHDFLHGTRVGVAWIFSACGQCGYCRSGRENLCASFTATGRDRNGGYAEYMVAHKDYVYQIPSDFTDEEAAPLLCAGAVGFRSLRLANLHDGDILGLTGFGASAHLVLKATKHLFPRSPVFVFARHAQERSFALELGADWAGDIGEMPPEPLHAAIDTTPAWTPVVEAMNAMAPGGRLVINAIRKEARDSQALAAVNYSRHLWMEKEIKSVANVTRTDVREFLHIASEVPIHPEVRIYRLEEANKALVEIRERTIRGAKVLKI